MCVAGAPLRCSNHAKLCANIALAMQAAMPGVRRQLVAEIGVLAERVCIHIGLNSGPIVAGVVGTKNPRWKLYVYTC